MRSGFGVSRVIPSLWSFQVISLPPRRGKYKGNVKLLCDSSSPVDAADSTPHSEMELVFCFQIPILSFGVPWSMECGTATHDQIKSGAAMDCFNF